MKPLNPFNIDLEKTTLIEASAGTGKTYTITTLFCRLIALGYPVESILVVTFTEKASAELKLRIRERISNTLAGLSKKDHKEQDRDPELEPEERESSELNDELVQFFCQNQDQDISLICQRFSHALNCFDQASIMTIHSFCLKILKEHAFESNTAFDIELLPDKNEFLNQVCLDFFMTNVNDQDLLFLSYLNSRQITPENFIASLGKALSRKDILIRPSKVKFLNVFDEYRQTMDKIYDILFTQSEEVAQLILSDKGIDKRSYAKRYVPGWLEKSFKQLEQNGNNTIFKMKEKGDPLYKFTKTRIAQKTKPREEPPEHELFELCEKLIEFYDIFENNLISLKIDFLSFFNKELEKIKKSQGICFFDDLVNDLANALGDTPAVTDNSDVTDNTAVNAFKLQASVQNNYKACLIDEFQDTDPKQYEIFSRLFSKSSLTHKNSNTPFFMIGDPKQAIYAFRGGDIFAYLKASKECDQSFTLEKNYRSAPLLVKGINEIFANNINPFLFEQIEFSKVSTPKDAINHICENDQNLDLAPLQFCFIKRDQDLAQPLDRQGFISKALAKKIIPEIVAKDIVTLLESDKVLREKKISSNFKNISPENIAILVRTNEQAQQIKTALSDYNVPSYLSKTGSVFDSKQAQELHDILQAVYNSNNSGYMRAALCTSVFGFTSQNIIDLNKNEEALYSWQERFTNFKQTWDSKGFTSMIMALLHHEDAFLNTNPGLDERGLTNFYHLVELISQATLNRQLSPYYMLEWYARQLSKNLRGDSSGVSSKESGKTSNKALEDELRLETDKKAVAIVTIHKSKGLEYPIVYLPYLWEGQRKSPTDNILFHDAKNDQRLTLDLGSKDIENAIKYYETEEQAEQRRLLYVALTRASAMCKIIWGGFNLVETSAFGSLLHSPYDKNACKDDISMTDDLKQIVSLAPQSILIESYADTPIKHYIEKMHSQNSDLAARQTSFAVQPLWKMSSFSGISHSSSYSGKVSDKKGIDKNFQGLEFQKPVDRSLPGKIPSGKSLSERISSDKNSSEKTSLVTLDKFPKGAGSGDLFHSIFENLDFTGNIEGITKMVQTKFDQFGFTDQEMIHPAITSVKEVLNTKLQTTNTQFCLKDIKPDQRFNEMEFIFPVETFKMSSIIKAFKQSDSIFETSGYIEKLSQLTTQSFKGFIKGFIDLVIHYKGKWYIVDYKSNYLGNRYDQYSQKAMFDAMAEHHYFLQYYIYTIALHRYLEQRLKNYDYNTHFGGVFYLFIRGMHPKYDSQYGVFHDCPKDLPITDLFNFKDQI